MNTNNREREGGRGREGERGRERIKEQRERRETHVHKGNESVAVSIS